MTFPDLKGDPMTTDTPTNRHDDEERIARALHAWDVADGPCDGPWEDLTEAQQEVWRSGAAAVLASLPAGLPIPPEAEREDGRVWWSTPYGDVDVYRGCVELDGGWQLTPDRARRYAVILLAAADVAEGGTR